YRFIKLPATIGLMVIGLFMSLAMVTLNFLGMDIQEPAEKFLEQVDFGETLMKGMLSFLLFAGALKININDLKEKKLIIGTLATGGVIATTFIVGTALYFILGLLEMALPYTYCLVFGALIAPTDPVAVLSILKSVKAPKSLEIKIAGESLFNDGVGVVVFLVMVGIATGGHSTTAGSIVILFLQEAIGGAVFGIVAGWLTYRMLKQVDEYTVEILLTLALVCGGYALASSLHLSGPIAIVVAGLLIGNYGRDLAMSAKTRDHLDKFWELIDEILNAVLFILIGLEILVLSFTSDILTVGLIAIPLTLGARFLSVWSAVTVLKFTQQFSRSAIIILTWGGLRGGISIALALSLAAGEARDLIVSITYVVVVFSILVQGLTIKSLIKAKTK
ncbi:MAG: sodium:proton antiporter, partial [candidate division Zixibacteria bacterium]|nr:sodium:proton antiporter [candidate division Zixibacteria bacterium]